MTHYDIELYEIFDILIGMLSAQRSSRESHWHSCGN